MNGPCHGEWDIFEYVKSIILCNKMVKDFNEKRNTHDLQVMSKDIFVYLPLTTGKMRVLAHTSIIICKKKSSKKSSN